MKSRILPVAGMLILPLGISLSLTSCWEKPAAAAKPVAEVYVTKVKSQDIPVYKEWAGLVNGYVNATITPRVQGYVLSQDYKNGQFVTKGQKLFTLDARPYEVTLQQAKAQLAGAEADFVKYQNDVNRYRELVKSNAVAQKTLDDAMQNMKTATAAIENAKASIEAAELNISYCTIISPIDGVAGIAKAQVGDLVSPQSSGLTTVSTINPIKVDFAVPETDVIENFKKNSAKKGQLKPGNTESSPRLHLFLADGSEYALEGRATSTDREVDSNMGTIAVVATFPNPDNILRPGMYGRVRAEVDIQKDAIIVPRRCVMTMQAAKFVFVVDPANNTCSARRVICGPTYKDSQVVLKGLKEGEIVVAEGILKAADVKGNPTVKPLEWKPEAAKPAGQPGAQKPAEAAGKAEQAEQPAEAPAQAEQPAAK